MQEECQRRMYPALAQRLSDIHQVVIVHPDEIFGLAMSRNRLGVALVYRLVSFPEGRLEVAEVLQVVKQRPDDFIGIAVVKLIVFCFAQCHRHYFVACVARGFGERRVRDVACDSRPTDPCPAASAQHRSEGIDQPTGRESDNPLVRSGPLEREW